MCPSGSEGPREVHSTEGSRVGDVWCLEERALLEAQVAVPSGTALH